MKQLLVRVPDELHAKITSAAHGAEMSRNAWIVAQLQQGILTPRRFSVPTDRPVVVTEQSGVVTVSEMEDLAPGVVRETTIVGCPHPKRKRQSLGYATRCEDCGEIIK